MLHNTCCTHPFQPSTYPSKSWVGRSSLWPHSAPAVRPQLCRLRHIFPPGYRSTWCQRLQSRCNLLRFRTDPPCGCVSERRWNATAPSGCCWPYDRAWGSLDSRGLWGYISTYWLDLHFQWWTLILFRVFLLTGWESAISALRRVSGAADGFYVDTVVGATGDAPHQAVGVQGVALCIPTWGRQGGNVGAGPSARRPGHVSHSLGDLGHIDGWGAARTSGRRPWSKILYINIYYCYITYIYIFFYTCFQCFTESW